MGLSRYVDRQTAGVLRIASFLCYGSQAELDFIVIPTSSVYGNASESVLWVWWFRISLPWGILPATVPCSVAVRPEELVISYVAFFIRLWTVISWLLFLPRWRFMFYFLNRSWRRYLVPRRLLPGKAFVFYSPVSAWSPHLGSLSPPPPRVEMAQIMQSLSFTLPSRRPCYCERPIQLPRSPQASPVEKGKIPKPRQPILKLRRKGNLERFTK